MKTIATSARWARKSRGPHRSAITLIELLFVMMILGILVAISLGALSGATALARVERTRAIITRLDQLITEKYESYKTRAAPIRVPMGVRPIGDPYQDTAADTNLTNGMYDNSETIVSPGTAPYDMGAAEYRLYAIRELMRCELPNTQSDVLVDAYYIKNPSLMKSYRRRLPNPVSQWTIPYEGAECLYLIVSSIRDGEDSALSFFASSEIGDIDGDGMKEFHDAFGNPIEFVRWPAGYSEHPGADGEWGFPGDDNGDGGDDPSEAGLVGSDDILPPPTPQTRNFKLAPDPFDPLKVDGRYRPRNAFIVPFALKPLIYSPGPDKEYDVQSPDTAGATALSLIDPYHVDFGAGRVSPGSPFDPDGVAGFADNITNHDFSEN